MQRARCSARRKTREASLREEEEDACLGERTSGETRRKKTKSEVESKKHLALHFSTEAKKERSGRKKKKTLALFLRIMSFIRYWMHRVSPREASGSRPECSPARRSAGEGCVSRNEGREIDEWRASF